MTNTAQRTRIRVVTFMLVSISVFALAVYALGKKSGLFEQGATLYSYFENLDGLVVGAPVRLSGLDIGTVADVEFPTSIKEQKARVTLSIKAKYLARIRHDSRAAIGSKGLLGDKLIDITAGDPSRPGLEDNSTIEATEAEGLAELSGSLKSALSSIQRVADQADSALQGLVTDGAEKDVQRALAALADLAEGARDNRGPLHMLIYDEQAGKEVRATLVELRRLLTTSHRAAARLDTMLKQVEQGPGGAHALLYGQAGQSIASDLQQASAGVNALVDDLQHGDGLAQALLYGDDSKTTLKNLAQASTRLNNLMAGIERGEGTLGALAVDPTVYEDLKTLIGNVDRNVILKALVRFAIKEGDLRRPAVTTSGVQSRPTPGATGATAP